MPVYAFAVLADLLRAIIRRPNTRIRSVEVVLLGDIFDLLRSDTWRGPDRGSNPDVGGLETSRTHAAGGGRADRQQGPMPWDDPDDALEARVGGVLDRLLDANAEAIGRLRCLSEALGTDVSLRYLPGNHDRAANGFAGTRRRIVAALALDHDPAEPFATSGVWPEYAVFAEHGDRHDGFNCERPDSRSCIGDAFVIHIMNSYYLYLRDWLAANDPAGDHDWLRTKAQEVDHVRPQWAATIWHGELLARIGDDRVREAVRGAWRAAMEGFLSGGLAQVGAPADDEIIGLLRRSIDRGPGALLREPALRNLLADGDQAYLAAARREVRARSELVDHVVFGHTHAACRVPLGLYDGRRRIYFNTGTWRHTINLVQPPGRTEPLLMPWQEMTVLIFYREGESREMDESHRFEFWQGLRGS